MTDQAPRVHDVYRDYRLGKVPFERVVEAADRTLARYEAARGASPDPTGTPQLKSPGMD